MNGKLYIAYGSNLYIERMETIMPEAKIIGTTVLEGWRLLFRQYATIKKIQGFKTPALVWQIPKQDEKNLDRHEGYPTLYKKQNLKISVKSLKDNDLGILTAMAYIMPPKAMKMHSILPSGYYFSMLFKGYEYFKFDKKILIEAIKECSEF